jgi:uncharacterized membrane protein
MALQIVISILCGVGLYTSIFMLRKSGRAERGLLSEPSVVQTARARLFGGVPNSGIGIVYYVLLGAGIWAGGTTIGVLLAIAASAAAATSLALAYSLLFVTRMPCVYCWTSHVVNWMLAALTIWNALYQFNSSSIVR